uniref:Uncharacterized protein n=1 Tax=Oryza nivara TaxID=4536 RepID=A0A0E0HN31_ORYNI
MWVLQKWNPDVSVVRRIHGCEVWWRNHCCPVLLRRVTDIWGIREWDMAVSGPTGLASYHLTKMWGQGVGPEDSGDTVEKWPLHGTH